MVQYCVNLSPSTVELKIQMTTVFEKMFLTKWDLHVSDLHLNWYDCTTSVVKSCEN